MSKYVGAFYIKLKDLLSLEELSLGEKLSQIEKTAKKKLIHLTDKEIYESLLDSIKELSDKDEKMDDNEFNNWVDEKYDRKEL